MKSGIIAAEVLADALAGGKTGEDLEQHAEAFKNSWLYEELYQDRTSVVRCIICPYIGAGLIWAQHNILGGKLPMTLHDTYRTLKPADQCAKIDYPKPDNKYLLIVFLQFSLHTNHEEDQPCHLQLADQMYRFNRISLNLTNLHNATAPQVSTSG